MKLQQRKTREVKGKDYFQSWVVIPSKDLESLGWDKDQELKTTIKGKKLIIEINEE